MRRFSRTAALALLLVAAVVTRVSAFEPGGEGGGFSLAYLATQFLPLTGGTMTGQQVFDGASGDILCDISTGASEPLTFCPASGQPVTVSATAVASATETIQRWAVSDAPGSSDCRFFNGTSTNARFLPAHSCYGNSNAVDAHYDVDVVNATYDTGTTAARINRVGRGTSAEAVGALITSRNLWEWQNYTTVVGNVSAAGRWNLLLYGSQTNCSDGAGAAACTAAPAGSVVIDDGATTVTVSTTAVTANSQIFPVFDSSLGTKLGVTCNTTAVTPSISARTAGTSFVITAADPAGANPACFSYFIVN